MCKPSECLYRKKKPNRSHFPATIDPGTHFALVREQLAQARPRVLLGRGSVEDR